MTGAEWLEQWLNLVSSNSPLYHSADSNRDGQKPPFSVPSVSSCKMFRGSKSSQTCTIGTGAQLSTTDSQSLTLTLTVTSSSRMNLLRIVLLGLITTAWAAAQSATLSADLAKLSPTGGNLAITATVIYDSTPGAIGWSVKLPDGWALLTTSGPDLPAVKPDHGAVGTLEWAYTAIPPNRAQFLFTVGYPAKTALPAEIVSTVFVRAKGELKTVAPAPIRFSP